jgi:formylglycine-generating enzyme required for sulfatase activity
MNGANPSKFKGPDRPVERVTWDEARQYCEAVGGRLPTEAEWEYAARAGTRQSRYGDLAAIAWYDSNSDKQTHPVGKKDKNPWGLYDMLGNVWEWVADRYQADYYKTLSSPAIDPQGPAARTFRVLRGGSWFNFSRFARASSRFIGEPEGRWNDVGFRCAREVITP